VRDPWLESGYSNQLAVPEPARGHRVIRVKEPSKMPANRSDRSSRKEGTPADRAYDLKGRSFARANFRTARSPHPSLDRYRLNHYAAIRLQALDQREPIAVVAMDDRIVPLPTAINRSAATPLPTR
jgi:hypothetical protein